MRLAEKVDWKGLNRIHDVVQRENGGKYIRITSLALYRLHFFVFYEHIWTYSKNVASKFITRVFCLFYKNT
jgi:hypothetical protein